MTDSKDPHDTPRRTRDNRAAIRGAQLAAMRRKAARYVREMAVMPADVWHGPGSIPVVHDALIDVARNIGPVKERAL